MNLSRVQVLQTTREKPAAHAGAASAALHASEGARVFVCLSKAFRLHAFSIKRVVICKYALPVAGGVKLGKQSGKRDRRRKGQEESA